MKKSVRILCFLGAAVMLLTSLAGCSAPRLTIGGTAKTVGTVDGKDITPGQFLAYMYNNFYAMYVSSGLYYYANAGYDIWEQTYPYGEGDAAEDLSLADYLRQTTKDVIVRQAAIKRLMTENGLAWDAEEEASLNETLKDLKADSYLHLGFSNENFIAAAKEMSLNETGAFKGLYGEGGKKAVAEADLKQYFDTNYLSYKIISKTLTDDQGAALDDAGKQAELEKLENYRKQYEAQKDFEKVVDTYNQATAGDGAEATASTDDENRQDVDATAIDENLAKVIREVPVGQAKVVEYMAGGSTPTAALIVRLDTQSGTLYADSKENIRHSLKDTEFEEEVKKFTEQVTSSFKDKAIRKLDPKQFMESGN